MFIWATALKQLNMCTFTALTVIPAKAGIQSCLHRGRYQSRNWIPAFAGMTTDARAFQLRANDGLIACN